LVGRGAKLDGKEQSQENRSRRAGDGKSTRREKGKKRIREGKELLGCTGRKKRWTMGPRALRRAEKKGPHQSRSSTSELSALRSGGGKKSTTEMLGEERISVIKREADVTVHRILLIEKKGGGENNELVLASCHPRERRQEWCQVHGGRKRSTTRKGK